MHGYEIRGTYKKEGAIFISGHVANVEVFNRSCSSFMGVLLTDRILAPECWDGFTPARIYYGDRREWDGADALSDSTAMVYQKTKRSE